MHKSKVWMMLACLLLLAGGITPAIDVQATDEEVVITASDLNVREGPGLSYPVVGEVDKGDTYSIISKNGEWLELRLSAGRSGWVAEWFTEKVSAAAETDLNSSSGIVTADSLRMRSGPGTSYQVIKSLQEGQQVSVISQNGNWVKIRHSGQEGWVSAGYLDFGSSPSDDSPSGEGTAALVTSNVNVRQSPSLNSSVVGRLDNGTAVQVISSLDSGWTEIHFNGDTAYVSSQYLSTPSKKKEQDFQSTGQTATVTASKLYIRDLPALEGNQIAEVHHGQQYDILEESNNWIRVEYEPGKTGWAAGWFMEKDNESESPSEESIKGQAVTVLYDGTNIRQGASVDAPVVQRASQGENYPVTGIENEWYKISLPDGTTGYIAGWLASLQGTNAQFQKQGAGQHLNNKTIVIDPGHGGRDSGTIGAGNTLEKELNLKTAKLLQDQLEAAGANVIMTRNTDTFVSLQSRISTSSTHQADAFISVHYDSIADRSIRGMTTYYYHDHQQSLADSLHHSINARTGLNDRGVRQGDYFVIRENQQNAVLLELGYLSNPAEEALVNTASFRESVAAGAFEGLAKYFKN